ncbi:branched-chain amino acid ABC transporter permease [Halococcus sediminicola]|uniref:branched-chain amino acid ABC transporter permease n=1 Tax=Halococcus sediminicola TaxID=1264579 RepID=UPI0006786A83|nr:branched-chain amino acid ABC transporter permease [Halococcus sediminicola]
MSTTAETIVTQAGQKVLTTPRYVIGIVAVLALALLPLQVEPSLILKLTSALYFAMFAISWDFVSGYTNQVSFGHTFLFAIGGYTTALLNLEYGVAPILSIPLGALLAGVGGVLLALPAIRVRGHYLALFTLMAALILERLFIMFSDTFGGETGLPQPQGLLLGEDYLATIELNYYLAYALFTIILVFAFLITRSDIGEVFTAIREDEEAVGATGTNATKFKIFAFATSGVIGGLAAGFLVHSPVGSASPSQLLTLVVMIDVLIVSIFGGLGTIVGPALSGISLYMMRDYLSNVDQVVPVMDRAVADLSLIVFYALTLVLLFVLPGGLLPWSIRQGRHVLSILPWYQTELVRNDGQSAAGQQVETLREGLTDEQRREEDDKQ